MNGIKIPVSLEVLQSSVTELQKILSNLTPKTTGYERLSSIIAGIRSDMDKIAIQGSKPFINQNQFTRAEKTIESLEEGFKRAGLAISRLKFSDLKLSPAQDKELNALQQAITNIKNSIKSVKEEAKNSILSGEDTKGLIQELDPSAATKTFDQLVKEIEKKTKQVNAAYEQAKKELENAEKNLASGRGAESLLNGDSTAEQLKNALGADTYSQFFNKNNAFKTNGSNLFADYLKKTYSLKESDVREIRNQTSGRVREILVDTNTEINKALSNATVPVLKENFEEKNAARTQMIALNQRVAEGNQQIEATIQNQQPALENATNALNRWKDAQTDTLGTSQALTAANEQAAQGLHTLQSSLEQGQVAFQKLESQTQTFNSLKMAVTNFMGFSQVLNLVKTGVREAANHIKELDSVMNGIAIVTDMSTGDLWKQIDAYSAMAQRYGMSIQGAYEVSKIYYQQGLETADVMTLTNETLKLSKISGMDYATATDYMTTAIRGFKMEMQDAATVVDVYSALAANTAVSQEELAVAMSKTASSMEGVGATFEEASAMIGTMVAVTRESATNIGSALKSIASRYGELTKDPLGLADSDGEAYSFNKVDTALQSVGISMKTVDGQFRNFTDVIIELGEKWNDLDSTQQRYIATQFAGNRQQSRFLALVSNVDTLKANIDVANNSEDTGTVQALKSLDSLETKIEQVRVAYQQFYTTIGVEDVWKHSLDGIKNFINNLNGLWKVGNKLPIGAISILIDSIALLKDVGRFALQGIANAWKEIFPPENLAKEKTEEMRTAGEEGSKAYAEGMKSQQGQIQQTIQDMLNNAVTTAMQEQQKAKETIQQELKEDVEVPDLSDDDIEIPDLSDDDIEIPDLSDEMEIQNAAEAVANAKEHVAEASEKAAAATEQQAAAESKVAEAAEAAANIKADTAQESLKKLLSETAAGVDFTDQSSIDAWIESLKAKAEELPEEAKSIPDDVIQSIVIGLAGGEGPVSAAASTMVSGIIPAIRAALNMHSPSPTIIAMFKDGVGNAVAIGLDSSIEVVESAAKRLGLSVSEALRESLLSKGAKVTLNDFFDAKNSEKMFREILRKERSIATERQHELSKAHTDALFFDKEKAKKIGEQADASDDRRKMLENLQGRIDNIQYENISSKFMIATHNFDPKYLVGMANWGGRMPSPSLALQSKDAKFREDFGGRESATAYIPYKFANPALGLSYGYTGDAYTPMIVAGSNTYEEARESLDSQTEVDFAYFQTRLTDFLRDAVHISNLEIAQEHLDKVATLPYGRDDYRQTQTRDDNLVARKENYLRMATEIYLQNSGQVGKNFNLNNRAPGAEMTARSALADALRNTMEQMLNQKIAPDVEASILRENLYTSFKDKAKIDVSSKFQDSASNGLIRETLKYLHFIDQNPSIDWMEVKPKGDVKFSDLPAFAAPYDYKEALQTAFNAQNGLDPKRTFIFNKYSKSGPVSKEVIDNYIRNNIPGVAFEAHGDSLVTESLPEVLNLDKLHAALSNSDWGIDELWQDILEKDITELSNSDLGTVFLNSIKASLSSIDLSNEIDSTLGIVDIIRYYSTIFKDLDLGDSDAGKGIGKQIVAGIILGMQEGLPDAVTSTSAAGEQIIAALGSSLGVASPSIYGIRDGKFLMLGAKEGIEEGQLEALEAAKAAGKAIITEFDSELLKTPEGLQLFKQKLLEQLDGVAPELQDQYKHIIESLTLQDVTPAGIGKIQAPSVEPPAPPKDNYEDQQAEIMESQYEAYQEQFEPAMDVLSVKTDEAEAYEEGEKARQAVEEGVRHQEPIIVSVETNKADTDNKEESPTKAPALQAPPIEPPAPPEDYKDQWAEYMDSQYEAYQEQFESMSEDESLLNQNAVIHENTSALFQYIDALDEEAQQLKKTEQAQEQLNLKQKAGNAIAFVRANSGTFENIARGLSMLSGVFDQTSQSGRVLSGSLQAVSGALKLIEGFSGGGFMAIVSGIIALINTFDIFHEDDSEKIERLTKEAQELSDAAKVAKNDFNTLDKTSKKYEELKEKRYESEEASEAYQEAVDDLTSKFPELIASFDESGNAILDESKMTDILTEAREKSAKAAYDAAQAELAKLKAERAKALNDSKNGFVSGQRVDIQSNDFNLSGSLLSRFKQLQFKNSSQSDEAIQAAIQTRYRGQELSLINWLLNNSDQQQSGLEDTMKTALRGGYGVNDLSGLIQNYISEHPDESILGTEYLNLINSITREQSGKQEVDLTQAREEMNQVLEQFDKALKGTDETEINTAGKAVKEVFDKYRTLSAFSDQIALIESSWAGGWDNLSKVFDYDNAIDAVEKSMASFKVSELTKGTAIENSTALNAIFSKNLNSGYEEWQADSVNAAASYDDYFNTKVIPSLTGPIDAAAEFYTGLSEDNQKLLESMFKDSKYYNAEDIIGMKQFSAMPEEVQAYLRDYYTDIQATISKRLYQSIKQQAEDSSKFGQVWRDLNTLADEQVINEILDTSQNLQRYGGTVASDFEDVAIKFLTALSGLNGEASAAVERILLENGFTIDGITDSIQEIEELDIEGFDAKKFTSTLNPLLDSFITSIPGRMLALSEEFVAGWKDAETAMNNAISGMDASSAQQWIIDSKKYFKNQEKKLNLTDLEYQDGNFYATAEQLLELRQGQIDDYATRLGNAQKELESIRDNTVITPETSFEELAKLATKAGLNLNNYFTFKDNQISGFTNGQDRFTVWKAIKDQVKEQAEELGQNSLKLIALYEQQLLDSAIDAVDFDSFLSGNQTNSDITAFKNALQNVFINQTGMTAPDILLDGYINTLNAGGEAAVAIVKEFKGDKATAAELEAAFNAHINQLNNVISQVDSLTAGQFVGTEGKLYEILNRAKAVDKNGVVKAGFNMVEVYAAIYAEMTKTAGATTADLNNAYAKLLTARDQKNIDTIDALENAANMSFDALAQLFNTQGRNLEKELPELLKTNAIGLTGFGGIRIFDFKAFAGKLGLLENTPEYYEAYSTYADSMVEFYNSTNNIIDNVAEQIKGLADAKPGKAINVSYLQQMLGDKFSEAIEGYGYMVQDGIMVLNQGADIPGLIAAVANKAAEAGQILPEQLAELSDAIAAFLSELANLISNGISGGLSHVDKNNLIEQAESRLGITDLEFTQTADGFKLVESSAIRLYQALKSVDSLQAGKVFEALRESLEGSNENFKTVEGLTAHIANLTKQINAEDQKVSSNRLEQYKAELEVAKEILAVRSTTEDDSFKFMEQDIPSGQNNPLNYWSNWQTAFEAINESKNTGKMDYKDFYNLMTEMANLSDMMGGEGIQIGKDIKVSSETVADLITQAGANLEVAADGSLKVNLSGIGVDFAASAKDMQTGVDKGIDALAQSQIDMLDSMIQLLETIVAMEKLSDIDVEGNGIDLGEMFKMNGENLFVDDQGFVLWQTGMQDAASKILSMADDLGKDSDLYKGLDNVKANGISLRQMLTNAKEGVKLTENEAKLYHATIAAFYKAMLSGDYSEDNIMASIKEVLGSTGYEGEIEVGDMHLVLKHGYVLERDIEGNYIVEGKKFKDEQKALQAFAAADLEDLLGNAKKDIDTETGQVIYHGALDAAVDVEINAEGTHYTANVGEYTVTSDSKEGIAAAIKTAALLSDKDWEEEASAEVENQTLEFNISQKGSAYINVTLDTETGDVDINPPHNTKIDATALGLYTDLKERASAISNIAVTQDVETGENKVADSVADNQAEGQKNSVVQDIKNGINETAEHLKENAVLAAEGVTEAIKVGLNAVQEAIKENQDFARDNPAVQTLTVNKVTKEDSGEGSQATGNFGLAKAKGTLMGELGPELVVSNGRYFIAGQNGAEMVDLADDAIVFNHLQTEQLLKYGMSSGRGQAVTNERNAVAFATGNFEGPAMASASAALNALKQLRAMWQSLLSASVSDLAGGGGGGGGGGGDKIVDPKAWIDTVERWYNLTQKIDLLEKDITHQQQLREKINSDFQKDGTAYYNSQRQSLKDLQEEIAAQEQLNISRQEYLNARVEALKKTPLGKIYSMDENGQFYWNDNTNFRVNGRNIKGGHDFLENLYGFDSQKGANYTNKQKFDILIANGFAEYMRTSANGETIKADSDNDGQISDEEWESYYEAATEAFRDKMDEYKETTQDLADKVQEGKDQILKKQQESNELKREIRDNQIAVEDNVLKAIEESRQREIDKLQDLRDAIEDSNQAYLDGLNKALENERDLYSQNESADELNRLRRQRDILTRSGGSASQIAQLNDEIAQKSQDAYFEAQQRQIDALQEASDLQLERLDNQIDIMTQTLEYQKEFGLLWGDVYNVMAKSPAEIAAFLAENTSEYWAQSPVKSEDTFREWLFQAQQWDSFKTDLADTKSIVANMYDLTLQQQMDKDYKTFNDQMVALHGANYDSSGKYKQAFYNEYRNSRDISKATQVAQSAYTADENAKKAAAAQARAQAQQQAAAQTQSAASGTNTVRQVGKDTTWQSNDTYHYKRVFYSDGSSRWYQSGLHNFSQNNGANKICSVCGKQVPLTAEERKKLQNGKSTSSKTSTTTISLGTPTKAAGGGYANHGLYELGERGTETVFTASQTKILRDNILSNRPSSLISLLRSYNENYDNINSPLNKVTTAEDNSVNIERVEMTMQVQQLANDYDARRAGEQALSEMLRIARKTSANNSIRR